LYYRQQIPKINASFAKDQPLDILFKKKGIHDGDASACGGVCRRPPPRLG